MKTTETDIAHRYELPYLDLGIQVIATVAQYGLGEYGPWYAIATLYPEPSDGPKCLWGCNGYPTRAAAQADLARWLSRHGAEAIEPLEPTPFKEVLTKAMKDSGFSPDMTVAELKYALVL